MWIVRFSCCLMAFIDGAVPSCAVHDGGTPCDGRLLMMSCRYVNRLTKPLVNALDAALQRYDDEKAKLGTPVS